MNCPRNREYCDGCEYKEKHTFYFSDPASYDTWTDYKDGCSYWFPDYQPITKARFKPANIAAQPPITYDRPPVEEYSETPPYEAKPVYKKIEVVGGIDIDE